MSENFVNIHQKFNIFTIKMDDTVEIWIGESFKQENNNQNVKRKWNERN